MESRFSTRDDKQTNQRSTQRYNLYEQVPADHGAHGRFDDRA